jgi:hypothetical protein
MFDDVCYQVIDGKEIEVHRACVPNKENEIQNGSFSEAGITSSTNTSSSSTAAITTLNLLAAFILVASIIAGIFIIDNHSYFPALGIFIALGGIIQWAFIKVFSGLAEDMKAIRQNLEKIQLHENEK